MSKKQLPKFKMGDMVEWTSQANGNPRTKIGVVIKIVRPGFPGKLIHEDYGTKSRGDRDHESYVVCIPSPDGTEFFWPKVGGLKLAERYMPLILARKAEKDIKAFAPPK